MNFVSFSHISSNILFSWLSQSEVFAVAFALLAAGAVILTLNVLLLVIASFSFILSYNGCRLLFFLIWRLFVLLKCSKIFDFIYKKEDLIVSRRSLIKRQKRQWPIFDFVFNSRTFQGGHIIFFQSLSLLGYCLFPLDVGALICMLKDNVIVKVVVVCVTLAWSSWAAYPFMSSAVNPRRKALALYPVFLMYVSVGFLIIAID